MWCAVTLNSPRLLFTRRPPFIANIEVACMYLDQACYVSALCFPNSVIVPQLVYAKFSIDLLPSHPMRANRLIDRQVTLNLILGARRNETATATERAISKTLNMRNNSIGSNS